MTAEVAIINRSGVALAADSAVTATFEDGRRKIKQSAHKIFTLSKHHPVGVMIYNNSTINELPWETAVKVYRQQLGKKSFPTLDEYAEDLLDFLRSSKILFTDKNREAALQAAVADLIWSNIVLPTAKEVDKSKKNVSIYSQKRIADKYTNFVQGYLEKQKYCDGVRDKAGARGVITPLKIQIESSIKRALGHVPLFQKTFKNIVQLVGTMITRGGTPHHTGLIVAGYGDTEVYPRVWSRCVDFVIQDYIKVSNDGVDNDRDLYEGAILPFAQQEMVQAFMRGVSPEYQRLINSTLAGVVSTYPEAIVKLLPGLNPAKRKAMLTALKTHGKQHLNTIHDRLAKHRYERHSKPILDVVSLLPKDELATMAESLVSLTSFKRKVSLEEETVGGPVDVALISKGDGFIWIRRKHYFKPELNHHFLGNYFSTEQ